MFQEIIIVSGVVRRSKSVTNLSSNLQLTDLIWSYYALISLKITYPYLFI